MVELTQADRDRAADTWRDYVAKLGECIVERAMRSGNMDDSSFAQAFATHRTQSTVALAAENERLLEEVERLQSAIEAWKATEA